MNVENNTLQLHSFIVHEKALSLLQRHATKTSGRIISFAECRRILSWLYHLDREEVFVFIRELERLGRCKIIAGHGIKIINERK